jgi:hypothetical protein
MGGQTNGMVVYNVYTSLGHSRHCRADFTVTCSVYATYNFSLFSVLGFAPANVTGIFSLMILYNFRFMSTREMVAWVLSS